jgi:hypothetical protein
MGLGQRDSVPSQLTVEAVVNQFRHLLENDGKRTEGYEGYLYFRSFSVVFAQLTALIDPCFNSAKEPISQSKSHSVSSVIFRMFRCFSSGSILRTSGAPVPSSVESLPSRAAGVHVRVRHSPSARLLSGHLNTRT